MSASEDPQDYDRIVNTMDEIGRKLSELKREVQARDRKENAHEAFREMVSVLPEKRRTLTAPNEEAEIGGS